VSEERKGLPANLVLQAWEADQETKVPLAPLALWGHPALLDCLDLLENLARPATQGRGEREAPMARQELWDLRGPLVSQGLLDCRVLLGSRDPQDPKALKGTEDSLVCRACLVP